MIRRVSYVQVNIHLLRMIATCITEILASSLWNMFKLWWTKPFGSLKIPVVLIYCEESKPVFFLLREFLGTSRSCLLKSSAKSTGSKLSRLTQSDFKSDWAYPKFG